MTISRTALCLLAGAALTLGACNKPATNQAGASGAPAVGAASSGPDIEINADDLPHVKAGLWSMTVSMNGAPPSTFTHCETGQPIKVSPPAAAGCTRFTFKRTFLGDYVMDAACAAHGASSSMHAVIHGDFLGGYTSDMAMNITMPGRGAMSFNTHTEAHYVGPCPAG